jgi:hypothetical protein
MDLRSLINKLDTIEQQTLLFEAEELMEKARIRFSDVEAVANQYKDDEDARLAALTKLIKDNGLPGLFDPVKGELVKPDGTYSWFLGASEETVQRLRKWGLLPDNAKSSSWLGLRGEDEKTAQAGNKDARSRDQMVDRAEELMKLAQQVTESINNRAKSRIEGSLLEQFGYIKKTLIEYIDPKQHKELKDLITKLTPFAKPPESDPDAVDLIAQFRAYETARTSLVKRIAEVIAAIKAMPAPAPAPAPVTGLQTDANQSAAETNRLNAQKPVGRTGSSATNESLLESRNRMIAEGRAVMFEDGTVIKDGQIYLFNEDNNTYYYYDTDGLLVEYSAGELWSDVKDTGRGVVSGFTLGTQDELAAGALSIIKGTRFKDELKKQIAATDAARARSPWLYGIGAVGGAIANPITKVAPWMSGGVALGREVFRPEINQQILNVADKFPGPTNTKVNTQPSNQYNAETEKLQNYLIKAYGGQKNILPKFGPDGKMGKETLAAIERAKKDGKLKKDGSMPGSSASTTAAPTAAATATAAAPTTAAASTTAAAPATTAAAPATTAAAPTAAMIAKVKAEVANMGLTPGSKISDEQLLALAQKLGINVANESKDLNDIRRLSGLPPLEEVWGAGGNALRTGWNTLRGAFSSGGDDAARAASGVANDAATAARTGTSTATTATGRASQSVGTTARFGGKTWDYVPGTNSYKVRGGSEVMSADDMALRLGRADGRLSPGGVRPGATDTIRANAGRRLGQATDDMARAGQAERGLAAGAGSVDDLARVGASSRIATTLRAAGGRFVNLLKNNRFLALIGILGAIGITAMVNDSNDEPVPDTPDTPPPPPNEPTTTTTTTVTPPVVPPVTTQPDPKEEERKRQEEERKRMLGDLNKLLAQLYGGWPTDDETAKTIADAVAIGATDPSGGAARAGTVGTQPAAGPRSLTPTQDAIDAKEKERENRYRELGLLPK